MKNIITVGAAAIIAPAANKLKYVTDFNLLAAGAIIAAAPTVIMFFILRKQFIAGLTLGSTKG